MHNVINYSFANLALADLLGLLVDAFPAIILTLQRHSLSDPGCRMLLFLPWVSLQLAKWYFPRTLRSQIPCFTLNYVCMGIGVGLCVCVVIKRGGGGSSNLL